ncbi:hypothetical protein KFL_001560080 [Klebsormidium nitens]|uniref:Sel1 repeat-containing protein n=1 Tax=Klebsormidium nitens TaxID=105231 RepID=A0A1Y1I2H9_KLENI|nr:hypothetical protein KFL_001560080 [Klebsormidium nitens]|eukprot:GAQ83639.1 hypothetical protein KFL_001560080 [Klebsormidium nitens]
MFGSGPSSESVQSLSPLRPLPLLDEHRAYSHPEDSMVSSRQEARAEQMYRDMAPLRFANNRPRSDVNIPQEPQVTRAALAACSFSSGFSGGSPASAKVSGAKSAMDVFRRSEGLSFMRMYGGFRNDCAVREALSAPREGVIVPREVVNVPRDGVNGPRNGANMPRDGVNVSRDGLNVPRDVELSNGGHIMTAFSRAPDGSLPKQKEGSRLSMAFEQERRTEMDGDTALHLEFYRSQQLSLPAKPPGRAAAYDPWARNPGFYPEALDHRSDKGDSIFVEFSPQDDLCPKLNINQLPAKFVATFLLGDSNRPRFEFNAAQYAKRFFSCYGAVSKTLVRENKNHPRKWFAIVEFSYWTNEEVRQRLVAGEQIRLTDFFDGEGVYVQRHKDKQSYMSRNGSGPSNGLPCRPDWKYTGIDTRLGKPLYRGPCSICGRESTVPFKPVVNGQPPRCRTCLPQDGNFAAPGGYAPQAMPHPRYEDARVGGLMSMREETLRTLSVDRGGSGVFLFRGREAGRSGHPHYGMDHQGFRDIARANQSFAGGEVSRAFAEATRGHGVVSRDGFVSGGLGGFSGKGASEAMPKRFEVGLGVEERREGLWGWNPSSNGGGFGVGTMSANGAVAELYAKAAERGYATPQCNLGWCYQHGRGVEKDEVRAAGLYAQAAEQGLARAQCNLGVCYEHGKGVEKDEARAAGLYATAADEGQRGHAA